LLLQNRIMAVGSKFYRPRVLSLSSLFKEWSEREKTAHTSERKRLYIVEKWQTHRIDSPFVTAVTGLEKFNALIHALNKLDDMQFTRSKQQLEFHAAYAGGIAPQIFGDDLPRYLEPLLDALGLDFLSKDVAVSCPRRFGKTTSVALFCAALAFTQGDMDIVIYSIAMRTSRMLTARIYTMLLLLSSGADIFGTNNQEILEVRAIGGTFSTIYSYPAPLKISTIEWRRRGFFLLTLQDSVYFFFSCSFCHKSARHRLFLSFPPILCTLSKGHSLVFQSSLAYYIHRLGIQIREKQSA